MKKRSRSRKCFSLLNIIIFVSIFILTNTLIIWDFNYPCFISESNRTKLIYIVKAYTDIMTELNITHWVDYGTLLGALRYETIAIWDYDADLSFDRAFVKLLHNGGIAQKMAKERYNIFMNAAVMTYEGMQADIFSWKKKLYRGHYIYTKGANRNMWILESKFNDFSASFLNRTVLIPFADGYVRAPYPPMEFIKLRYPTSYNSLIPFKVSCYFPWNIPYWLIFNRPIHKIE